MQQRSIGRGWTASGPWYTLLEPYFLNLFTRIDLIGSSPIGGGQSQTCSRLASSQSIFVRLMVLIGFGLGTTIRLEVSWFQSVVELH